MDSFPSLIVKRDLRAVRLRLRQKPLRNFVRALLALFHSVAKRGKCAAHGEESRCRHSNRLRQIITLLRYRRMIINPEATNS